MSLSGEQNRPLVGILTVKGSPALTSPRHPLVRLTLHSRNPLAWVSGVRQALRTNGASHDEIARFSTDALESRDREETWKVIANWVDAELL